MVRQAEFPDVDRAEDGVDQELADVSRDGGDDAGDDRDDRERDGGGRAGLPDPAADAGQRPEGAADGVAGQLPALAGVLRLIWVGPLLDNPRAREPPGARLPPSGRVRGV